MRANAIRCMARYWTGPREGERCRARAIWINRGPTDRGMRLCGIHARAYLNVEPIAHMLPEASDAD